MEPQVETKLRRLPALDVRNQRLNTPRCKVCDSPTRFFDVVDFNKHCSFEDPYVFGASGICVPYFRCRACGFLFTNFFEHWTSGEFSRFVYNADYVKVDSEYVTIRPARVANSMIGLLRGCEAARILDYGSGTGAFSRLMREAGFGRIEDYDPFSSPARPEGRFDIISCFEVIEHTASPIETLGDMKSFLAEGGCIVFSQTLQPSNISEQRSNWWYLGPRNGHMSTFTAESLAVIAEAVGLVFHFGTDPYALTTPVMSPAVAQVAAKIGEPLAYLRLYAPGDDVSAAAWHPAEHSSTASSRWSKLAQLDWPMPTLRRAPCTLRVAAPVNAWVADEFVEKSQFRLGAQIVPARFEAGELRADISVPAQPPEFISMLTPEPISPRAVRGIADDRLLGLAIDLHE